MSDLDHLAALEIRHKKLDKQCSEGFTNYLDDKSMNKMKMEKHMVKNQIDKIKKQLNSET